MARSHSRSGGLLRGLRRLVLLSMVLGVLWTAGLIGFAASIPRSGPTLGGLDAERETDAIVVLTGGSRRLRTGLKLLEQGLAHKLFVSGVYDGVDVQELLRVSRQAPGDLECCIVLGYAADSTLGNAFETADWMREQNYHSLRLVTANYHMRRSLLEFRMAMPDAEIVPHPVMPENFTPGEWWIRRGTANVIVNEYNKYLVALLRYEIEGFLN